MRTAVESNGDGCYDTEETLAVIDGLISVGGARRQNEADIISINDLFLGGFQKWLNSFTATKRGVVNSKNELIEKLAKLLTQ